MPQRYLLPLWGLCICSIGLEHEYLPKTFLAFTWLTPSYLPSCSFNVISTGKLTRSSFAIIQSRPVLYFPFLVVTMILILKVFGIIYLMVFSLVRLKALERKEVRLSCFMLSSSTTYESHGGHSVNICEKNTLTQVFRFFVSRNKWFLRFVADRIKNINLLITTLFSSRSNDCTFCGLRPMSVSPNESLQKEMHCLNGLRLQ